MTNLDLKVINHKLADQEASQIVQWAVATFENGLLMSTSFGIQSAVMLHLVTQIIPDIPVIWVDTGYLPSETYCFAEKLTQRLNSICKFTNLISVLLGWKHFMVSFGKRVILKH